MQMDVRAMAGRKGQWGDARGNDKTPVDGAGRTCRDTYEHGSRKLPSSMGALELRSSIDCCGTAENEVAAKEFSTHLDRVPWPVLRANWRCRLKNRRRREQCFGAIMEGTRPRVFAPVLSHERSASSPHNSGRAALSKWDGVPARPHRAPALPAVPNQHRTTECFLPQAPAITGAVLRSAGFGESQIQSCAKRGRPA